MHSLTPSHRLLKTVEGKQVKPNPCAMVKCGNNCGNIPEERLINIFNQKRSDWIAQ